MKHDPKAERERLTNLLGEVKFAERQLEKTRLLLPALEAKARQALVAGKRDLALKYATQMEEQKDALKLAEQKVAVAKHALETAKRQGGELKEALKRKEAADNMGKIAELVTKVGDADDMIAQVERETAINEAKVEMAMDAAELEAPLTPLSNAEAILAELEREGAAPPAPVDEAPKSSAEDILKEFE
jgi:phage shock protein A